MGSCEGHSGLHSTSSAGLPRNQGWWWWFLWQGRFHIPSVYLVFSVSNWDWLFQVCWAFLPHSAREPWEVQLLKLLDLPGSFVMRLQQCCPSSLVHSSDRMHPLPLVGFFVPVRLQSTENALALWSPGMEGHAFAPASTPTKVQDCSCSGSGHLP